MYSPAFEPAPDDEFDVLYDCPRPMDGDEAGGSELTTSSTVIVRQAFHTRSAFS